MRGAPVTVDGRRVCTCHEVALFLATNLTVLACVLELEDIAGLRVHQIGIHGITLGFAGHRDHRVPGRKGGGGQAHIGAGADLPSGPSML